MRKDEEEVVCIEAASQKSSQTTPSDEPSEPLEKW